MRERRASDYVEAVGSGTLTPARMLRVFRELMDLTQKELAEATGIAQSHISSLETGRAALGIERARRLGKALNVHPVALIYPSIMEEQAALAETSVKVQVLRDMVTSTEAKGMMSAALSVFVEAVREQAEVAEPKKLFAMKTGSKRVSRRKRSTREQQLRK